MTGVNHGNMESEWQQVSPRRQVTVSTLTLTPETEDTRTTIGRLITLRPTLRSPLNTICHGTPTLFTFGWVWKKLFPLNYLSREGIVLRPLYSDPSRPRYYWDLGTPAGALDRTSSPSPQSRGGESPPWVLGSRLPRRSRRENSTQVTGNPTPLVHGNQREDGPTKILFL